MNSRRSKTAGVLTAALFAIAATQANATVVVFENPAGAGHFDWVPAANQNGLNATWLDITQPANSQPGAVLGHASFGQENFSDLASKVLGGGPISAEIQVGFNSALALVSVAGELVPAETPLPPSYGWAINPFIDHPSLGSNLVDGQESYLGVRFDLGSGWQHGWIGIEKNGIALDAFAWGYETEPGVPIAAGIPEPTTLALFALAAGSLCIRRRRRFE